MFSGQWVTLTFNISLNLTVKSWSRFLQPIINKSKYIQIKNKRTFSHLLSVLPTILPLYTTFTWNLHLLTSILLSCSSLYKVIFIIYFKHNQIRSQFHNSKVRQLHRAFFVWCDNWISWQMQDNFWFTFNKTNSFLFVYISTYFFRFIEHNDITYNYKTTQL